MRKKVDPPVCQLSNKPVLFFPKKKFEGKREHNMSEKTTTCNGKGHRERARGLGPARTQFVLPPRAAENLKTNRATIRHRLKSRIRYDRKRVGRRFDHDFRRLLRWDDFSQRFSELFRRRSCTGGVVCTRFDELSDSGWTPIGIGNGF